MSRLMAVAECRAPLADRVGSMTALASRCPATLSVWACNMPYDTNDRFNPELQQWQFHLLLRDERGYVIEL